MAQVAEILPGGRQGHIRLLNIIFADVLVTQGPRALAATIWTSYLGIFWFQYQKA